MRRLSTPQSSLLFFFIFLLQKGDALCTAAKEASCKASQEIACTTGAGCTWSATSIKTITATGTSAGYKNGAFTAVTSTCKRNGGICANVVNATFDVTIVSGDITSIAVNAVGNGNNYAVNDVITLNTATVGTPTTPKIITVTAVVAQCKATALATCAKITDPPTCVKTGTAPNDCTFNCEVTDYIQNHSVCRNDCSTCRQNDIGTGDSYSNCKHCYCHLTQQPPKPSKVALNLCYQHTKSSCCLPVFDAEIEEHYNILLDAGDRCLQELVKPKLHLRDLFCMACSPYQPDYLVDGKLRICKSLADEITPEKFDQCGMMKVEERGMEALGDDSVMPSLQWANVLEFIKDETGAKPPFLEDYEIEIVENNENCFGKSGGVGRDRGLRIEMVGVVAGLWILEGLWWREI
eukprot:g1897.t1